MLKWEDYYFITEVVMQGGQLYGMTFYIIIDKATGQDVRGRQYRSIPHAMRSVKRLMQKLEIQVENALLGD